MADIRVEWEPPKVYRYDRLRTVTVEAALEPGTTAMEVNSQIIPWLDQQRATWGPGYGYELGGEAETAGESQQSIGVKLPIAGLIIVMLLIAQFNSIRKPAIILMTIPLAMIGVTIGLLVAKVVLRIYDVARHYFAGRNCHQQRDCAHRPNTN